MGPPLREFGESPSWQEPFQLSATQYHELVHKLDSIYEAIAGTLTNPGGLTARVTRTEERLTALEARQPACGNHSQRLAELERTVAEGVTKPAEARRQAVSRVVWQVVGIVVTAVTSAIIGAVVATLR